MADIIEDEEIIEDDEILEDDEDINDDEIIDDEELIEEEEEEEDIDSIPVVEYQRLNPANKKTWSCPSCKFILTTYTQLVDPPICGNPEGHYLKSFEMVEYTRKKEALVFNNTNT
jgi:rubrerythrin